MASAQSGDLLGQSTLDQGGGGRCGRNARAGKWEAPHRRRVVDVGHRRVVVQAQPVRHVQHVAVVAAGQPQVGVVDRTVVRDTVEGPLSEPAYVVRHATRDKDTELLQHRLVVSRERGVVGAGGLRVRRARRRRLHEGGQRDQRGIAVLGEGHERAFALGHGLHQRVPAELELRPTVVSSSQLRWHATHSRPVCRAKLGTAKALDAVAHRPQPRTNQRIHRWKNAFTLTSLFDLLSRSCCGA